MSKTVKVLVYFLVFDAVVAGAYFGYKALAGGGGGGDLEAVPWVTVDASYQPRNDVEAFIKTDAENREALPVEIRNYGANEKVLKRFKGKQLARPSASVLEMFFKGLDDWMIVAIKYKAEKEREVVRTVLYVFQNKQWKVGDSGSLLQ
jgi:hypothetical protein